MLKISLASARVNAKYTQKEAAVALGVSNCTLANWENGKTFPSEPAIRKLCELYGIHYDNIRFEEGK